MWTVAIWEITGEVPMDKETGSGHHAKDIAIDTPAETLH